MPGLCLYLINNVIIPKISRQLGSWSIPLLSIPLLVPLVWVQSNPPSLQEATLSIATATDGNPLSLSPPDNSHSHHPPINRELVAAKESVSKTHNYKPQVKGRKSAAASKKSPSQSKAKPHYTAPAIEIRVAIATNAPNLAVATSSSSQILDGNGALLQHLPSGESFNVQPNGNGVIFGSWQLPPVIWIESAEGGAVYVVNRWYRGRLLLVSQGSTLLAVNYVDLEQYLYSVVGSEMSASAPLEALKAQAIAARSYALVHIFRPTNNLYDLGAGERWQVYRGLEREYNTTFQAVSETSGQILSYQGGVVESLYAASEEIVAKAHGGVGMSQTGAYEKAAQGYDYRQILAVYYPGSEVARLGLKH